MIYFQLMTLITATMISFNTLQASPLNRPTNLALYVSTNESKSIAIEGKQTALEIISEPEKRLTGLNFTLSGFYQLAENGRILFTLIPKTNITNSLNAYKLRLQNQSTEKIVLDEVGFLDLTENNYPCGELVNLNIRAYGLSRRIRTSNNESVFDLTNINIQPVFETCPES